MARIWGTRGYSGGRALAALAGALLIACRTPAAGEPVLGLARDGDGVRVTSAGDSFRLAPADAWIGSQGGRRGLGELRPLCALHTEPLAEAGGRSPGKSFVQVFRDPAGGSEVTWSLEARNGEPWVRVRLRYRAGPGPGTQPTELGLIALRLEGARRVGDVAGSPVATGTVYLGAEDPLGANIADGDRVSCASPLLSVPAPGEGREASAVVGFAARGQLRRAFLGYLERERARPYAPFLHHNTWYSIGYFNRFTQADEAGVIGAFRRELIERRGVRMDGFVLDDGWDDPASLWRFNPGFPGGLAPVRDLAGRAGAGVGLWLSPWGGYGKPRAERLAAAAPLGFETREGHFSLAGPRYHERFRQICLEAVRAGSRYFKFDGIGSDAGPDVVDPASGRDFEAMIRLVRELRSEAPGVYINQTTGTWASPFWLLTVDSIWRGGDDHTFAGTGPSRERWITYRDLDTYQEVVRRGPLYPLNSLMLHGIIYAAKAKGLQDDPSGAFVHEVRSYFGTGTQLQELYVSPELLSPDNWDQLAAAARWARAHTDTLVDTHWLGGDPSQLQVYGWAAWSPRLGILTLRNPSDREATFPLELGGAFELPAGAPRAYTLSNPYGDGPAPLGRLEAGKPALLRLAPFEVLVLEAHPAEAPR